MPFLGNSPRHSRAGGNPVPNLCSVVRLNHASAIYNAIALLLRMDCASLVRTPPVHCPYDIPQHPARDRLQHDPARYAVMSI